MTALAVEQHLADLHQKLESFFRLRLFEECLSASNQVLALVPNEPRFQLLKGMSLLALARIDEANVLLRPLLDKKRNDFDFLLTAGNYASFCKAWQEALAIYDLAIHLYPSRVKDTQYNALYRRALERTQSAPFPLQRHARFYAIYDYVHATNHLFGAIAECGCFRGLSSYIIATVSQLAGLHANNHVWIFDSFEGLSEPSEEDIVDPTLPDMERLKTMTAAGSFAASYERVKANLCEFTNITLVKGWIPTTFNQAPEQCYRFVNLDVDLYHPTRDSLAFFVPRLLPGGVLLCDDYNWPGGKRAIDEFLSIQPPGNLSVAFTDWHQVVIKKH